MPTTYTQAQVVQRIKDGIATAGSLRAYAKQSGASRAYLSLVTLGKLPPGPIILRFLGLRRERQAPLYVRVSR